MHTQYNIRKTSQQTGSYLAYFAVAFGLLITTGANAQDSSSFGLEEIVVTAAKRGYAESLQSVPMSIQALPERTIEQAGIKDFTDFARMAPSVSMAGSDTGTPQVSIRGVRTTAVPATTTQENPLTSIYYDDLPVSMANFNPNLDLFDIQRIEVLRGPQGTLYGAGAMGGNIRFVTNKPNLMELEGKVEASLATTKHGGEVYDLKVLVNVPVVEDKFALRITGTSHWDDGYVDNNYLGIKDFDKNKRQGARISALFQPTEDLSITANFIYQDTTFKQGRSTLISRPGELPIVDNPTTNIYGNSPFLDELQIYNLAVEYDLGWATAYSSSSYFKRNMSNAGTVHTLMEAMFGLQIDAPNAVYWDNKDFVQEFRLTSVGDERLNWVIGAFYSKRKVNYDQDFTIDDAENVFGFPTGGYGAPNDDILFFGDTNTKQKQYAVFGEATYKITDKLHATAGLRWFKSEQDFDLHFAGLFQGGTYRLTENTSADGVTPKFALAYHASDAWMIYANAAKGYRLGGMNEPVPEDLCAADLSEVGLTEGPTTFGSDSLWSYELGTKSQFFQRRMTLNASVFYIDWKNIQTLKSLPNCGFYFTENAGALESKGFEVEMMAMPMRGLTLTLAATYTDATLAQDVPNLIAVEGDRTPYVPKWSASASAEYVQPVTDSLNGYIRFDLQHVGKRYTEFNTARAIAMPSYEIGNIHLGIQQENWEIAFFVKNIWDKRALTSAGFSSNVTTYVIERPRTIGVTLRANY